MDEGSDFKKIFFYLTLFIIGMVYIRAHYTIQDLLKVSRKHPHEVISPKVDYYVGLVQYKRDMQKESFEAFQQLLTDYPTSYYVAPATFRKGMMFIDLRQFGEARREFETYQEKFPEGNEIRKVEKKYEQIRFK